jgi:hypothetical protein
VFSALCQNAVDRQWSRTRQDEGRKAREVKEIGFKARRPELLAACRHSLELDRTEPVRQMHDEHSNQNLSSLFWPAITLTSPRSAPPTQATVRDAAAKCSTNRRALTPKHNYVTLS